MTSPLRAEVYFVNLKTFTNLKWGTRDPVAFKDSQLGLIRLRAFGVFNLQVVKPGLFINSLVGTQGILGTEAIEDYLNQVIVSRLNDYLGETLDTLLNLPAIYDEMSEALSERLKNDFSRFGLSLNQLFINAITPPQEVQQAIDDRSRMGVIQDMNKLMQMKTAMAIEKAAENESAAGAGMGTGLGFMMPGVMAPYISGAMHPQQQGAAGGRSCVSKMPKHRACGCQILPPVRPPAATSDPLHSMRKAACCRRQILPGMRPFNDREKIAGSSPSTFLSTINAPSAAHRLC